MVPCYRPLPPKVFRPVLSSTTSRSAPSSIRRWSLQHPRSFKTSPKLHDSSNPNSTSSKQSIQTNTEHRSFHSTSTCFTSSAKPNSAQMASNGESHGKSLSFVLIRGILEPSFQPIVTHCMYTALETPCRWEPYSLSKIGPSDLILIFDTSVIYALSPPRVCLWRTS